MKPPPESQTDPDDVVRRGFIENVSFWKSLNPECTISDNPWPENPVPYDISGEEMAEHADTLRQEGYFQTPPLIPPDELDQLARCVSNVVRWRFEPDYAFVYDQFYAVLARLGKVLTPILGPGYQLVAEELNVFFVANDNQSAGFSPHRDPLQFETNIAADGLPNLLTIWIPLTDASPLNSCVYIVPAHLDPYFADGFASEQRNQDPRTYIKLRDIRALPATAGSILCWNTRLLHWGSRGSHRAAHPRISFGVYFQRGDLPPSHPTVLSIPSTIPFRERIYLIERRWSGSQGTPLEEFRKSL